MMRFKLGGSDLGLSRVRQCSGFALSVGLGDGLVVPVVGFCVWGSGQFRRYVGTAFVKKVQD